MQDSVFVIRVSDEIRRFFYDGLGISHCNAQPCKFDHRQIVIPIAAADHVFGGQPQMTEEFLQSICFVNVTGHDLKEKRLGQIDVQQVLILLLSRS